MPTVGQYLLTDALPEDLRHTFGELTKKHQEKVLQNVAEIHPDKYRDVLKKWTQIGNRAGLESGGYSFGPEHLRTDPETMKIRQEFKDKIYGILNDPSLQPDIREGKLVATSAEYSSKLTDAAMKSGLTAKNPFALQVYSGSKGNPSNYKSLIAGDTLYVDSHYKPVPFPVLSSYYEGLRPHEYVAGTFGGRLAIVLTKLGTAKGGWFGKRISNASHRLVVSELDGEEPEKDAPPRGLVVDVNDPHNEGALLAHPVGGYPRNTVLTRKVLDSLLKAGHEKMLIRSPLVGGPADGGVYGRDVGVRERGTISPVGDYVGLAAAQSIAEPATQQVIGSKHTGGVAGNTKLQEGFPTLDKLISIPQNFPGGAVHSQLDGVVTGVREAEQGGKYIIIDGKEHYVHPDLEVNVKAGDHVEAGDPLTNGTHNPAELVKHKGIGEGRRLYVKIFIDAAKSANVNAHRRNVELIARGLIDHVELNQEYGSHAPGDIIPYTMLEHEWEPRDGHKVDKPKYLLNHYLEKPVLHYTIGTRITPSVVKMLEENNVDKVVAHSDAPPFEPRMLRSNDILLHDPDWMTKGLGSNVEKGLLHSAARGEYSDTDSTSFVPALAEGVNFSIKGKSVGWEPKGLELKNPYTNKM